MSDRRQVWETLAHLLQRVENSIANVPPSTSDTSNLDQEIRKMGKTQHKANLLAEEQNILLKQTLTIAHSTQEQNARLLETLNVERTATAQKDTLEAILPALDSLEYAIASGWRYLQTRDRAAKSANLTPQLAILVSPADRAILEGWLGGLNLVRERLLSILETGFVTPIASIGQPFDPYLHVAVGTTQQLPPGVAAITNIIVAEERRGYRCPAGVIRFAEVIVYRPK
jgi:molecular chaperone GrpE